MQGVKGSTEGRKIESSTRACLVPWKQGQRMRRGLGCILQIWGWNWGTGLGGMERDMNICSWPTPPSLAQVACGSQGVPVGIREWDEVVSWRREVRSGRSIGSGEKWKEGKLQQVDCCRAGNETGGLDFEERKERWRSAISLPASLNRR